MHSLISFAIAGASLLSTVSAAPVAQASSAPFTNPVPFSSAGFPDPNAAQLLAIELQAHGTLPNGSPPAMISANGITNLQLVEFNENFEVAFFGSLLNNITTNVPGFQIYDTKGRGIVIDALTAILAQEELHALNAEAALTHFGHQHILPCKYVFPTTNFQDAIALAATFTDLVLGTLQDVIELFANANDNALTRGVASVLGQEGEQEGFFRLVRDKKLIPSSQPFLTTSTRDFAFSALQGFVAPGSCPNSNLINLKIFGPLNLATKVVLPQDQTLTFNFDVSTLKVAGLPKNSPLGAGTPLSGYDWNALSVQFINGQNTPISAPLKNIKVSGTVVTFDVFFPFTANLLNGLTIAAVTVGSGPFISANAVALQTLFGPGLIEVN
ncbi:late sexual development protein [Venturia nashicola]|uniref:Late sexual development protein n=1 Tax=Venturia nashicola TaxID=86259 RepID=A0A4Z1PUK0_9PEZI|nr:late sexual development protein [Venturia nashicola]TLD38874.1 late sexual development protein [Venturia nashicola]